MRNAATSGLTEQRRDRRERSCEDEQLRFGSLHAHEAYRDGSEAEAERDERSLGPEDETERKRRERGEQDARELDQRSRSQTQPFERGVAAVPRQAQCGRNQDAREPWDEDDVPPGRFAPVESVRNLLPDEVGRVVQRRLEEHRGERHRDAERRCEDERSEVRPRPLVHGVTLLAGRDALQAVRTRSE